MKRDAEMHRKKLSKKAPIKNSFTSGMKIKLINKILNYPKLLYDVHIRGDIPLRSGTSTS